MPPHPLLTTVTLLGVVLGACGGGGGGPVVATVEVEGFELADDLAPPTGLDVPAEATMVFDPTEIRVPEGRVEFRFTNTGRIPHTFVIEARGFKLRAFETGEVAANTVDLPAGSYFFYCDIEGHRDAGMEGGLFVGDAPDEP